MLAGAWLSCYPSRVMVRETIHLLAIFASTLFLYGCANDCLGYSYFILHKEKLRPGMGAGDVERILGKPDSITTIDGIQYWKWSEVKQFEERKVYVPIDEKTLKIRVSYIKISSVPSPVFLEVNGAPVGKTPYNLPVIASLEELPSSGVENNGTLINPPRLKAISIVNGGMIQSELLYRLQKEYIFYTPQMPHRAPTQIDVNIRHVR
jgi:hypothetical protein